MGKQLWADGRGTLNRARRSGGAGALPAMLFGAVSVGAGWAARADPSVVLEPTRDTTIYQVGEGEEQRCNALGPNIFVGENSGGALRRGLLFFDVAGSMPSRARVTGAMLTVQVTRSNAGELPLELHRMLAAWGTGQSNPGSSEGQGAPPTAGDATWVHRFFPDAMWAAAGGDYEGVPLAQVVAGDSGAVEFSSDALTAAMQHWIDDPLSNMGLMVRGVEDLAGSAKRLGSRENASAASRPRLEVWYTAHCIADFNDDGGVDGGDVEAFYGAFVEGLASADVNDDGGVDGGDVETFFTIWQTGACD